MENKTNKTKNIIALNTSVKPKAKTSNDLLIKLLNCEYCDFEYVNVECTKTKGFVMVNRG